VYMIGGIKDSFNSVSYFLPIYFSIAIMVNITALIEVSIKRKKIIEEYQFLRTYFL